MDSLLQISNLSVTYNQQEPAIAEVTFLLRRGTTLALTGESGSGKTTLCRALTRLFPRYVPISCSGSVLFNSRELLACSEAELRTLRENAIRYIFQEPYAALNPVLTVERQMSLAGGSRNVRRDEITEVLATVGLPHPGEILNQYPHQLSVGMAQRVLIAMALLTEPSLLIADEPTSALDASLRRQILDLLKSIQLQKGMAMILVTHDLALARRYADDILVLKKGRIVEMGTAKEFFTTAQHPYSRLLIEAALQTTACLPTSIPTADAL